MTKPLLLALFVSIALNGLFGYLSYSFYSDKAVAESQLSTAVKSNKDLKESLDKKGAACTLQDKITAENQTEQQQIVEEKDADLNAIDKMASVSVVEEKASKGHQNVNETSIVAEEHPIAGMDDLLPEPLRVLLQDSCNRSKGSPCIAP